MTLYRAPTGLVINCPIPQGVALGWYVTPLQGLHEPWHKLPLSQPDTEVRCYDNGTTRPGGERGASSSSRPPALPALLELR